jgi:hypothetical protein
MLVDRVTTRFAPSAECLACRIPLEGWAGSLAMILGAGRSAENPNLCRRCGAHFKQGQIHPVALLGVSLESDLRFGAATVEHSLLETTANVDQLRAIVERAGGFIPPPDHPERPCQFEAYFNLPVPAARPAQAAVDAATLCLEQVRDQETSIGFQLPTRLVLLEGYAEVYTSRRDQVCYPHSLRRAELAALLPQAPIGEIWIQTSMLAALDASPPCAPGERADDLVRLGPVGPSPLRSRWRRARPRGWPAVAEILALLMAFFAAPCAAMMVVSPIALALGLGALSASVLPLIQGIGAIAWLRIGLTLAALLLAVGNWIGLELGLRQFRALQRQLQQPLRLPSRQRRRALLVRSLAVLVLLLVALEAILRVVAMKMPLL